MSNRYIFIIFEIMKNDIVRISHETQSMRDRIKENKEKIKVNKTLPYLVSNVIEVSSCHCIVFNGRAIHYLAVRP
jgi:ATP-dependent 26S proteasome regulatory subunit